MTKKRQILFSVIRGLLAILIALLVATLLIFLSADAIALPKSSRPRAARSSSCWSARCSAWAAAARNSTSSA